MCNLPGCGGGVETIVNSGTINKLIEESIKKLEESQED